MQTELEAKVEVVNKVNKAANELEKKIKEILKPFRDDKIRKGNGELLKKISDLLPKLKPEERVYYYFESEVNYSLHFKVYGNFLYDTGMDTGSVRHETFISLGYAKQNDRQKLGEITDLETRRIDWTVEEVQQARKNLQNAEEQQRKAASALGPFGKYDR